MDFASSATCHCYSNKVNWIHACSHVGLCAHVCMLHRKEKLLVCILKELDKSFTFLKHIWKKTLELSELAKDKE